MPHGTTPYLLFRFFQDFALVYPVYVIFFQVSGLDYRQIGYLLAIWALAVVVLEVPSGLVSDLWSRRGTLAIAMILKAAGFLVWLLRPDFAGFAWGFVLWGAQEAFTSGTTDALLFDALRGERAEERFVEISGKGAMAARVGIMASGEVIYQGRLQERIESAGRATVSSIFSFVYTLSGIAVVLIFGGISERYGLDMLMITGAVIVILLAIAYGVLGRTRVDN